MWFVLVGLVPALAGYLMFAYLYASQRPLHPGAVTLGLSGTMGLLIVGLVREFQVTPTVPMLLRCAGVWVLGVGVTYAVCRRIVQVARRRSQQPTNWETTPDGPPDLRRLSRLCCRSHRCGRLYPRGVRSASVTGMDVTVHEGTASRG